MLTSRLLPMPGSPATTTNWQGPAEEKVIRVWDLESGACRVLGPFPAPGKAIRAG